MTCQLSSYLFIIIKLISSAVCLGNDEQCSGALAQVFRLALCARRWREDVYVVTGAIIHGTRQERNKTRELLCPKHAHGGITETRIFLLTMEWISTYSFYMYMFI